MHSADLNLPSQPTGNVGNFVCQKTYNETFCLWLSLTQVVGLWLGLCRPPCHQPRRAKAFSHVNAPPHCHDTMKTSQQWKWKQRRCTSGYFETQAPPQNRNNGPRLMYALGNLWLPNANCEKHPRWIFLLSITRFCYPSAAALAFANSLETAVHIQLLLSFLCPHL